MVRRGWCLSLGCFLIGWGVVGVALAGVNNGGTLVIHDTGVDFSAPSDLPIPPASTPPAGCAEVDNIAPPGDPAQQRLWKVYAAFGTNSTPRLKGLAWGIAGTGRIYVTAAGLPDPATCFEIVQGAWPSPAAPGGPPSSIGQSFAETQTARLIECYWFGGYGYQGAIFSTGLHATQPTRFVDDGFPQEEDEIVDFGAIGFGISGNTPCPAPLGACCGETGSCTMIREVNCDLPSIWHDDWVSCQPNPCPPPPLGACCYACGQVCLIRDEFHCVPYDAEFWMGPNTNCEPNPCPPGIGACCSPDGSCTVAYPAECAPPSNWHCHWECDPNWCPQPQAACCNPADGECVIRTESTCIPPAVWHPEWATCEPNPCPQPQLGACCDPASGECHLIAEDFCLAPETWHGDWMTCAPNPCPLPPLGACCSAFDGSCELIAEAHCAPPNTWHGDWPTCMPNPCPPVALGACCLLGYCFIIAEPGCPYIWLPDYQSCTPNPCLQGGGACCYSDGTCAVETPEDCSQHQGQYQGEIACIPNPCPVPTPISRTTWGRVKNTYR